MARFEPIDLTALSTPASQPQVSAEARPERPSLLSKAIWIGLVILAVMWWRSGGDVTPGPDPIDADGLHVLVVEPDDPKAITKLQSEFVNSIKIADWVDSKQGQYRRFRQSQDISKADPIWQKMKDQSDATNRVVIVKDKRPYRMPIPDGVEAGIQALEGIR